MHKLLSDQQGLHYWFTFGSFVVWFLWFVPCVSAQCVLWNCVNTFQRCHHFLHKNYDLIILLSGLASLQGNELLHVSDCIPAKAEGRVKSREPSHIAGWPTECQVMSGLNKPACSPHYWYFCLLKCYFMAVWYCEQQWLANEVPMSINLLRFIILEWTKLEENRK